MYTGDYLYKLISCKIFKIMRNVLLLMMITVFQVNAVEGYSQNTKLSLNLDNVTVGNVLEEIENQSEFYFLFNAKLIDIEREVSISIEDQRISNILASLFSGTGVSSTVRDRLIILTPGNMPAEVPEIPVQQQVVAGTVTDSQTGEAMPGVNIVVKGTNIGTISDINGKYSLPVTDRNAILVFSFVGYVIQEAPLNGRTTMDVALVSEMRGLDEVVVVGYGTQRKVNVLGSIATVKADELTVNPMPTVAQSIMGKAPGMFIKVVGGQPGDESNLTFNIRGFGDPLIIIDGGTSSNSDFQNLNPNEIESFSILKDAAAASVYGARAGNGVVLVTTKRGLISAPKITYNSNFEWQYFLAVPDWVNSEERVRMENVYRYNEGLSPIWSEEQIQKFHDGSDPDRYPNTDWWNLTVRKFAPQQLHNLSVQGGTDRVKYFVSGGYFYQEAMLIENETKNKRYNLRSNIDITLTKKLKLNLDLAAIYNDYWGPMMEMERGSTSQNKKWGIMTLLFRARSYGNFSWPDPTKIAMSGDGNPWIWQQSKYVGYKDYNRLRGDAKVGFSYDLPLGIKAKANYRIYNDFQFNKEVNRTAPQYFYNWDTDEYTFSGNIAQVEPKVYQYANNSFNFDQQYFLDWSKKIEDQTLSAMIGYEILSDRSDWFEASRVRYAYQIDYLFAGPTLDQSNGGKGFEGGRMGIISRINYDYKGKYLFEVNGRYDASPKFPRESRWGFFPSASIGWRISEESFIKENLAFIDNLKLRASYGKLGYDNTGNFQFLETYSLSGMIIKDGNTNTVLNGIKADALPNPSITWEKMTTTNIGLDFNILNNLLEGSFDYFYRLRTDVLGTRIQSIPNIVGATMPQVNYAEYDNRGWEFALNHRNTISDIDYSIGGNISWNREKTVYIDQNVFASDEAFRTGNKIGEWTDSFWGYMTDGLFQTKEEIDNWADIDGKGNATILPGDVRFIDYNGDKKITVADQVIIGRGAFPKLFYGINMTADWKGLNFSMLWQGAGLYDFYLKRSPDLTQPFYAGDTPTKTMLNEYYVPEGQSWLPPNTTNAKYPRYRGDIANRSHPSFALQSEQWLINGAYIRLKSVELGYTLPADLTRKWNIDKCKFYVSGYNVLTFSALDFMDPEVDTATRSTFGDYYPPVGTYNVGLLLQF